MLMKALLYLVALVVIAVVLLLGELYSQIARYQKHWDSVNQKPIGKDDLVYVAFGDSAAQGIGATDPDKGYVGLVAKYLSEHRDKNVRVINLSKSGAKVSDVIEVQLPKYRSLNIANEQVVTIEIGANDIVDFDAREFERQMDQLMPLLPEGTVISDLPSFKGSRLYRLDPKALQANEITHKLAKKHGFEPAMLYKRVAANHGIRTLSADLFHPSNYGYRTNWAPAFIDKIEQKR